MGTRTLPLQVLVRAQTEQQVVTNGDWEVAACGWAPIQTHQYAFAWVGGQSILKTDVPGESLWVQRLCPL